MSSPFVSHYYGPTSPNSSPTISSNDKWPAAAAETTSSFTIFLQINFMYGFMKDIWKGHHCMCVQLKNIDLRNVDHIKYWQNIVECLNTPNDEIKFFMDDVKEIHNTAIIFIALDDWRTVVAIDKIYPIKDMQISNPKRCPPEIARIFITTNQLRQLNNIETMRCHKYSPAGFNYKRGRRDNRITYPLFPLSWKSCKEGKLKEIVSSEKRFPMLKDLSARSVVIYLFTTA